jgi:hypothetical protein
MAATLMGFLLLRVFAFLPADFLVSISSHELFCFPLSRGTGMFLPCMPIIPKEMELTKHLLSRLLKRRRPQRLSRVLPTES